MKKRFLFCIVVGICLLILAACSGGAATAVTSTETPEGGEVPPAIAEEKVMSEAKVIPAQNVTLSFTSPGVVAEVLVGEGEPVKADQTLARLKGGKSLESAVDAAELTLLQAQQAYDQFIKNAAVARAQAQVDLAQAKDTLKEAEKKRKSKDYGRASQAMIDAARADYLLAQDAVDTLEDVYEGVIALAEDDPNRNAVLSQLAAARQNRDRALANYNWLLAKPDEIEIAKADAAVESAQAVLKAAEDKFDQLKDGPDPEEMNIAEARVKNAKSQLEAAKAALSDLEIKAPFEGVIVSNNLKAGEYTSPGVGQVVLADLSVWKIETTDLTEMNIPDIQIGDKVKVTFDAIPDLEIPGKVERIKSLGETRMGDITYTITVALDHQDERLFWNMTSFVVFEQ